MPPQGPLWLAYGDVEPGVIGQGIRIGISKNASSPLRFTFPNNRFVSGPRALNR